MQFQFWGEFWTRSTINTSFYSQKDCGYCFSPHPAKMIYIYIIYIQGRNNVPTFLSKILCILRYVFALAHLIAKYTSSCTVWHNKIMSQTHVMCVLQVNGIMHSMYISLYIWQMLCAVWVPFGFTQHSLLRTLMDGLENYFMVQEILTSRWVYACMFISLYFYKYNCSIECLLLWAKG